MQKIDLLNTFITRNPSSFIPEYGYFLTSTEDGVCLGQVEKIGQFDIVHYKTFITEDQLFDSQYEKYHYTRGAREHFATLPKYEQIKRQLIK